MTDEEWEAFRLQRRYDSGFKQGLRGEKLSVPLEATKEMWEAKKRGYADGLARGAELAKMEEK